MRKGDQSYDAGGDCLSSHTIVTSFHSNKYSYIGKHSSHSIFSSFVFRTTVLQLYCTILFSVPTPLGLYACDACAPFVPFAVAPPPLFFVPPPTALETIQ